MTYYCIKWDVKPRLSQQHYLLSIYLHTEPSGTVVLERFWQCQAF